MNLNMGLISTILVIILVLGAFIAATSVLKVNHEQFKIGTVIMIASFIVWAIINF